MARKIAFLGLGIMGAPMARRLVEAGHDVAVYNRTPAKAAPLVAAGARAAATPQEAAASAEVVVSIVTDGPDVEEILLGPAGAALGAPAGALFVDMSTIAPGAARRIGAALGARGFPFLDAPVTGGDVGARDGTLSILVGGQAADLDRIRDLLRALGRRITHCGPVGAGQTVKACNQILCAVNMAGVVEALASGAGGSWALEKLGPRIARRDFAPGFMVKLIQKDLRIVQEMARAVGLPVEGTTLAQRRFADNEAHGEGNLGTQAMYRALERAKG